MILLDTTLHYIQSESFSEETIRAERRIHNQTAKCWTCHQ